MPYDAGRETHRVTVLLLGLGLCVVGMHAIYVGESTRQRYEHMIRRQHR